MGLLKKAMEISILSGAVVFLHISNQDNPDDVLFYSSVDLNESKNHLINNLQKKTREIFSNDDYKKLFLSKGKQSPKKEPAIQNQENSEKNPKGGSDPRRRSKRTQRPTTAIFSSHKDMCKKKEQQANDEMISTISMAKRSNESHFNHQINLIPDEGIAKNCMLKSCAFDEETDLNTKNQTKNTNETLMEELNVDTKKNYLEMNNILEDSHINVFSINCNINDNIMLFAHCKEPIMEKEKLDFFQECDFNIYCQNVKDENLLHYDNFSTFSNSL